VLLQAAREVKMLEGRIVLRMNDVDLKEIESIPVPPPRRPRRAADSDRTQTPRDNTA
jgi:hypothetical protein